MSRKRWIQNPEPPYNLVSADEYVRPEKSRLMVYGDMPDILSPIDGRVISGRKGFREHCNRYGVTNASDYTETWAKQKKERGNLVVSQRKDRVEAIKHALEKHHG